MKKNSKKNFGRNKEGYAFKDNQIKSKIVRTFNSSGEMNHLQMEGEAIFISNPPESKKDYNIRLNEEINETENFVDSNESNYNLGFNEFRMNVVSNMELISNEFSPNIIQKLTILSQIIKFEIFKDSNNITEINDGEEINGTDTDSYIVDYENEINNNQTENEKRILESNKINYPRSYKEKYTLFNINFLGVTLNYRKELEINYKTGLRRNSLIYRKGNRESILSRVEDYQYYHSDANHQNDLGCTDKAIIDWAVTMFGFGPKVTLSLTSCLYNSIHVDIQNNQMITSGFTSHEISLKADLKIDFFVRSSGVKITNQFIKGDSYIQAKSIANSYKSEFVFYRSLNFNTIYLEIYFTKWRIFWEDKYSKTFKLFGGYFSYQKYTNYL